MEISNLDINLGDTQYNKAYIGDKELYQKIVPTTNCPPTPCECAVIYNDSKTIGSGSSVSSALTLDASKLENIKNGHSLFKDWKSYIINLDKIDTSYFTSLYMCFAGCSELTTLDLSGWNISKVTTLEYCFQNCSKLTSLDIKNWNLENVTKINFCFYSSSNLTTLDLSGWNTSKITNINSTFAIMGKLTELYLDGWDLSAVTSKSGTFSSTTKLQKIYMRGCNQTTIDLITSLKPAGAEIITE